MFCAKQGKVFTAASEVSSSCDPRVESADGRILHPCGLSAAAVFTDEFSAVGEDKTTEIELDESRDAICWNFDLSSFKNPTEEEMQGVASKVKFWLYDQPYVDSLHMEKAGGFQRCLRPPEGPLPLHLHSQPSLHNACSSPPLHAAGVPAALWQAWAGASRTPTSSCG